MNWVMGGSVNEAVFLMTKKERQGPYLSSELWSIS